MNTKTWARANKEKAGAWSTRLMVMVLCALALIFGGIG